MIKSLYFVFGRRKPTLQIETTNELKPTTTLGSVGRSNVLQGINNLFSADIVIQGTVKQSTGHYICAKATDG